MTTNQTIDGVTRELIEDVLRCGLDAFHVDRSTTLRQQLRALLDAKPETVAGHHPACRAVDDYKPGDCSHNCKPAAQPQGDTPDDDKSHPRFIAGYTAGLHDHNLGQPQGVPVAWANWKVGSKSYVPFRTVDEARRSVNASEISATQNGPYRVVPLYAEQPAPVAVSPTCCGSCPGGCVIGAKP